MMDNQAEPASLECTASLDGLAPDARAALAEGLHVSWPCVQLGQGLEVLFEGPGGASLLAAARLMREQLATELGFVADGISFVSNYAIEPTAYRILLGDMEVGAGTLQPERTGAASSEPIPCLLQHIETAYRQYPHLLLQQKGVHLALQTLAKQHPKTVEAFESGPLSPAELMGILQFTLRGGLPIRNLTGILAHLSARAQTTRSLPALAESLRTEVLQQEISARLQVKDEAVAVLALSPRVTTILRRAAKLGRLDPTDLEHAPDQQHRAKLGRLDATLQLPTAATRRFVAHLRKTFEAHKVYTLMCAPDLRLHVEQLFELHEGRCTSAAGPRVICADELADELSLDIRATVGWPGGPKRLYARWKRLERPAPVLDAEQLAGVETFRAAADAGNVFAAYHMGLAHYHGAVLVKDFVAAIGYFRLAAVQGHLEAQALLGAALLEERACPRDVVAARRWLERAAARGSAQAQWGLGKMYNEGNGVPRDAQEALRWFELAAKGGDGDAQQAVADSLRESDPLGAARWYLAAAAQGFPVAMIQLSFFVADKVIPPLDLAVTDAWVELARATGDADKLDCIEAVAALCSDPPLSEEDLARLTKEQRACYVVEQVENEADPEG